MWCFSIILFYLITFSNAEYFEECSEIAKGTLKAYPEDCHSYIYCGDKNTTSFIVACPDDLYFDEETTTCVIDKENICPGILEQEEIKTEELEEQTTQPHPTSVTNMPTSKTPEILTTVPIKPVCDRQQDAYYPHYQHCEYYFKCIAGFLTILRCNFFYAWDYHKETCVPADIAECYGSSKVI